VTDSYTVEFYSHVMHIVSNVVGQLAPGKDALDALFAGFPAGTVSGAPKVRACEIIAELEPETRGRLCRRRRLFLARWQHGQLHRAAHRLWSRMACCTFRRARASSPTATPPMNSANAKRRAGALMAAAREAVRVANRTGIWAMILVIDNYDSFTWNLVHYLMELGPRWRLCATMRFGRAGIASGAEAFLHLARPVHAQRGRNQP
jgi:hypothetical protein